MDWTKNFCKKTASDVAESIINEILREIYSEKLEIHTAYNLTLKELGMLYRWPLYVGVNTFVERLIRTCEDKNRGVLKQYYPDIINKEYYISTAVASIYFYNYFPLNANLLNSLSNVISSKCNLEIKTEKYSAMNFRVEKGKKSVLRRSWAERTQTGGWSKYTFKNGITFSKIKIISFYLTFMRFFIKPDLIYEDSKNLNLIFPVKNRFQELPYNKLSFCPAIRSRLKDIFIKVFLKYQKNSLFNFDKEKNIILAKLFSEWIDLIMPLSIVEGLSYRLNYYQNSLNNWNVQQIHISTGHFYNDNLKCFSLLARRKNAKLIAHDHGTNNFVCINREKNDGENSYKHYTMIHFCDYYLPWGSYKISKGEGWNNVDKVDDIKIFNSGSVYLSKLTKWKKLAVNKENIVLLYVSGPLRNFMANIEENTPEKIILNRKKVLLFLEKLLQKNETLKILYKPIPGVELSNDITFKLLSKYIDQGRVKISEDSPIKIMPKIDIALFDMISTGFSEAIEIGVPSFVYGNSWNYEQASDEGKIINDELEKCGVIFYDTESGIKSFERIVNDLRGFQRSSKETIRRYQEAIAYPVSKDEFLNNMFSKIS